MFTDFVLNGQGHGEFASHMTECRFDTGLFRPFIDDDGHRYVLMDTDRQVRNSQGIMVAEKEQVRVSDLNTNGLFSPIANATLALRKDQWIQMDQAIVRAARKRLRAWTDLAASATFGGFNAMNKMILEHEALSDAGEAKVDMDGLTEGTADTPATKLYGTPLPITHSSFWFSQRVLSVSRGSNTPLDLTQAEAAGRRVAEQIEKTVIGTISGLTYGVTSDYENTPTVYGYMTHPSRATKTDMTAPSSSNGTTVVDEILELRELLYAQNFYGPFMCYVSTNYDQYIDNDFKTNSDKTTRQRILEIDNIQGVRRLDYLSGDVVILVQMTSDVARAIDGMPITTIQWDTKGGMQQNFKVMAIQVPQIRADYSGNCGVAVGTTS